MWWNWGRCGGERGGGRSGRGRFGRGREGCEGPGESIGPGAGLWAGFGALGELGPEKSFARDAGLGFQAFKLDWGAWQDRERREGGGRSSKPLNLVELEIAQPFPPRLPPPASNPRWQALGPARTVQHLPSRRRVVALWQVSRSSLLLAE